MIDRKLELPSELQTRLDMIIQSIPRFWEQRRYAHFINQGPSHSDRVYQQKLAQLASELPEPHRLSSDEIFIVSAAAWLYEVGMQSPTLKPILDFEYEPGQQPTPQQLREIRERKHLLSQRLIWDSLRPDYRGPQLHLGLTSPPDDYAGLIADVCRWCSPEPLEEVPDKMPVNGLSVRLRLLVALLRMADQLYIENSRVSLDLLEHAVLPTRQKARWWAYHYAQILPIVNGQIRFHYFIPADQKEYLGHIRALIEPDFEFENNSTIRYLWENYQLHLMPDRKPSIRFDQHGFKQPLNRELLTFLRFEVKDPIETPLDKVAKPEEETEERCLLVLDYENFILQLGQEGRFFTPEEISGLLMNLLEQAGKEMEIEAPIDALAVGHWHRPNLTQIAKLPTVRIYDLITLEENEYAATKIEHELTRRLHGPLAPKHLILVAPPHELAPVVKRFTDSRQVKTSAWISHLPETIAFRGNIVVRNSQFLSNRLSLAPVTSPNPVDLAVGQMACLLRLEDKTYDAKHGLTYEKIIATLSQVGQVNDQAQWWYLLLTNRALLVPAATPSLYRLNPDSKEVRQVWEMRDRVIEVFQTLAPDGASIPEGQLVEELTQYPCFQDGHILSMVRLLQENGLLYCLEGSSYDADSQAVWYLNLANVAVLSRAADRYLPEFVVALDHVIVREGFPALHDHTVTRHLATYLPDNTVRIIFDLAKDNGWVQCQVTSEKRRQGDGFVMAVSPADDQAQVGQALRNRDIIVNILYHKSARAGLVQAKLWEKLNGIRACTLTQADLNRRLTLMERDAIISISADTNPDSALVKINTDICLTQRLLGRMHVYGLIRNLRLLGATGPDRKKSVSQVLEQLGKFVTDHDEDLACWTLEYARDIRLVKIESNLVYLNQHSLVRRLDHREEVICKALADLVKRMGRRDRDGWLPNHAVIAEMDKDIQYGYCRGEHDYWLDQAIYRRRVLEQKKERIEGRLQHFVRSISK